MEVLSLLFGCYTNGPSLQEQNQERTGKELEQNQDGTRTEPEKNGNGTRKEPEMNLCLVTDVSTTPFDNVDSFL